MKTDELISSVKEDYWITKVISGKTEGKILFLKHKQSGKKVVLKCFPEPKEIYGFLKTIAFKHLPIVYDTYMLDDGFSALEEYIDGINVAEILESGKYTYRGAKIVLSDVCDALTVLHDNGYIHRDVKPENVMVAKDGTVKLIDFNIARAIKENIGHDTQILGTVGYAPPEQFGISQTDTRADIYAAGVLLNVMLTGKHPSDVLAKGKAGKIVLKCTQIDPDKRYADIQKLKKAL